MEAITRLLAQERVHDLRAEAAYGRKVRGAPRRRLRRR